MFPVSDVKVTFQYGDRDSAESNIVPVTDDECIPINFSFSFDVNINNPIEIDRLISSPGISKL